MAVPTQEQLLAKNPYTFPEPTVDTSSLKIWEDIRYLYRLVNTDDLKINMIFTKIHKLAKSASIVHSFGDNESIEFSGQTVTSKTDLINLPDNEIVNDGTKVKVLDENMVYEYNSSTNTWFNINYRYMEYGVDIIFDYLNSKDQIAFRHYVNSYLPTYKTIEQAKTELSNLQLTIMFIANGGYTLGVIDNSNSKLFGNLNWLNSDLKDGNHIDICPMLLANKGSGFIIDLSDIPYQMYGLGDNYSSMPQNGSGGERNHEHIIEGVQVNCNSSTIMNILTRWNSIPSGYNPNSGSLKDTPISEGYVKITDD